MKFMVFVYPGDFKKYEAGVMPEPEHFEAMHRYNEALIKAGIMVDGGGLHPPSQGRKIHFSKEGGKLFNDGPASEIAGFWIWQTKSQEEAMEWVKRAPMEEGAVLELRRLFEPEDFGPDIAKKEQELSEKIKKQNR